MFVFLLFSLQLHETRSAALPLSLTERWRLVLERKRQIKMFLLCRHLVFEVFQTGHTSKLCTDLTGGLASQLKHIKPTSGCCVNCLRSASTTGSFIWCSSSDLSGSLTASWGGGGGERTSHLSSQRWGPAAWSSGPGSGSPPCGRCSCPGPDTGSGTGWPAGRWDTRPSSCATGWCSSSRSCGSSSGWLPVWKDTVIMLIFIVIFWDNSKWQT